MQLVKQRSNLTWKNIANNVGINRSMIFFYLDGHSKISLDNYRRLCLIAQLRPEKIDLVEINNKAYHIRKPNTLNEDLAELVGIIAGDGHISAVNYEVSVSGNLLHDGAYIKAYVKCLFERIFSCHARIYTYKPNHNIKCIVHSKELVEYLNKRFRLPIGRKKNRLHIPKEIANNKKYLKPFIRGLFDTDGSIYQRRKKEWFCL